MIARTAAACPGGGVQVGPCRPADPRAKTSAGPIAPGLRSGRDRFARLDPVGEGLEVGAERARRRSWAAGRGRSRRPARPSGGGSGRRCRPRRRPSAWIMALKLPMRLDRRGLRPRRSSSSGRDRPDGGRGPGVVVVDHEFGEEEPGPDRRRPVALGEVAGDDQAEDPRGSARARGGGTAGAQRIGEMWLYQSASESGPPVASGFAQSPGSSGRPGPRNIRPGPSRRRARSSPGMPRRRRWPGGACSGVTSGSSAQRVDPGAGLVQERDADQPWHRPAVPADMAAGPERRRGTSARPRRGRRPARASNPSSRASRPNVLERLDRAEERADLQVLGLDQQRVGPVGRREPGRQRRPVVVGPAADLGVGRRPVGHVPGLRRRRRNP